MKKIIAMLAVTAVLCSFTSCGQDTAEEVSEESSEKSVSEVSEEETTESETEEITESETEEITESETESETKNETEDETESTNEQSENLSVNGSYEDALNMFIDCANNKDIEGLMKVSFPDKYIDAWKLIIELSGTSLDELIMNNEESDETLRLVEIVSAEPLPSEELDDMVEIYSTFELINQYIEENGKDNIDEEKFESFLYEAEMENPPELYFEVPDVQIVKCIIESTSSTGETEIHEEFIMYYIDGEGWKVDMSLMGYVKKSKQLSVNTSAKTIMVASNISLSELDEYDIVFPDCIISSDHSKNYNISDDYVSQFEEKMEYFLSSDEEYKDYNYIIEIKGGAAVNVAITKPEEPNYIGVYPITDDEYKGDEAFDELYNMYLDDLQ